MKCFTDWDGLYYNAVCRIAPATTVLVNRRGICSKVIQHEPKLTQEIGHNTEKAQPKAMLPWQDKTGLVGVSVCLA